MQFRLHVQHSGCPKKCPSRLTFASEIYLSRKIHAQSSRCYHVGKGAVFQPNVKWHEEGLALKMKDQWNRCFSRNGLMLLFLRLYLKLWQLVATADVFYTHCGVPLPVVTTKKLDV